MLADEIARRYLFVASDRASRWVFIRIYNSKTAANARRFLRDLERACPLRIRSSLTDTGKAVTDRLFGLQSKPGQDQRLSALWAKAQHHRKLSGPILRRDLDHF